MNDPDWSKHYTKWAAGVVTAYVVRAKMEPNTIAKILTTAIKRGRLTTSDVKRALDGVELLSVQGFESRNPERRRRLEEIEDALATIQQS